MKIILLKLSGKVPNIPHWLPGSWMKREVREGYVWRDKTVEIHYQYALGRMVSFG